MSCNFIHLQLAVHRSVCCNIKIDHDIMLSNIVQTVCMFISTERSILYRLWIMSRSHGIYKLVPRIDMESTVSSLWKHTFPPVWALFLMLLYLELLLNSTHTSTYSFSIITNVEDTVWTILKVLFISNNMFSLSFLLYNLNMLLMPLLYATHTQDKLLVNFRCICYRNIKSQNLD